MAVIRIKGVWDTDKKQYIPSEYSIEGEGLISVHYEFMNAADYAQYDRDNNTITIGPYKLKIVAQSRQINGEYLCEVINGNA